MLCTAHRDEQVRDAQSLVVDVGVADKDFGGSREKRPYIDKDEEENPKSARLAAADYAENQWEAKDHSCLCEEFAKVQIDNLQEIASRAGIVIRQAHHIEVAANVLPFSGLCEEMVKVDAKMYNIVATQTEAASTIQRFARKYYNKHTHHLIQNFHEQGPTIERAKSIRSFAFCFTSHTFHHISLCFTSQSANCLDSFEDLIVFLRKKEIIAITKACLQRVHLSCTFRHQIQHQTDEKVNVRIFLAGYMIAYRPTHVFESMGVLEHELLNTAGPLLETFHSIIDAVRNSKQFSKVPSDLTRNFPAQLFEYLKCFMVCFSIFAFHSCYSCFFTSHG